MTLKTIILTAALALASTGPAMAHSKMVAYVPADGATVADVPALEMSFDKPMRVIAVSLTANEADVAIKRETGMDPVTAFRAVPNAPLDPGDYVFEWRGMSDDGHPMQGTFTFTVAP